MKVFSIWLNDSDELNILQVLSIKSFLKNGHEFTLYTYKDFNNVPDGCVVKDASEFIPENLIFKYQFDNISTYAIFSDVLRVKILHDVGGMYVDLDIICISRTITEDDYYFIRQPLKEYVVNGAMKCPKESDFIKFYNQISLYPWDTKEINSPEFMLLGVYTKLKQHSYEDRFKYFYQNSKWGISYRVLQQMIKKFSLEKFIHDKEELFICDFKHVETLFDEKISLNEIIKKQKMWGIHVFNSTLKNNNIHELNHGIIEQAIELYL